MTPGSTARPHLLAVALPVVLPVALATSLALMPHPAHAQEPAEEPPTRPELGEGLGLLGEGARLILRGLMEELDLAMRDLGAIVDDMSVYHPPEILPNGDILIRRKVPLVPDEGEDDAPPFDDSETPEAPEDSEIEL